MALVKLPIVVLVSCEQWHVGITTHGGGCNVEHWAAVHEHLAVVLMNIEVLARPISTGCCSSPAALLLICLALPVASGSSLTIDSCIHTQGRTSCWVCHRPWKGLPFMALHTDLP